MPTLVGGHLDVEVLDGSDLQGGPVVDARALRAVAARTSLPGFVGCLGEEMIDASEVRHLLGLGDREDIAQSGLLQHAAQPPLLAVGGVCGHPGDGQRGGDRPQDHGLGQVGLGGEGPLVRDVGGSAAVAVVGPGLGQIQLPVRQGASTCGGVGGEHADLAVLGVAGGAGVPALHAGRGGALLEEASVVEDEDPVGLAEPFGYVVLEVVAELVGVPAGAVEEPLEAVGCAVSGGFGQLPAVLAANRTQQPTDVITHPATRLNPLEAVAGTQEQFLLESSVDVNQLKFGRAGQTPGP